MNISARHKARCLALQAIYQWQFDVDSINEIKKRLTENSNPKKLDVEYFNDLVVNISKNVEAIDAEFVPFLDRAIKDISPTELAILRIAAYELIYRLDVPYKVVIDEALRICKVFGATDGFKYINGVLDKLAHKIRAAEFKPSK